MTRSFLEQIPFDLGHRTAMGRSDFLIAPSNRDAVAWIDLWPNWPAPVLIIYGPVASGKTHLAEVWREKSHADFITISDIQNKNPSDLTDHPGHFILDEADILIGNLESEKKLFHLYNIFKENNRTLLLTLISAPVHQHFALPDLASRLRAAPAVAIREPDDALLAAIMVKLFNDRQLRVGADVIGYILPRVERSFESVRAFVDKLDQRAMMEKKSITPAMVKSVFDELASAA
ncbi:MAG: DNA replication protein [Alphaproteobacteria bacterium]|nr:DNA replication protein [Alphaproteobacteria bacterium]